jgi:integrase
MQAQTHAQVSVHLSTRYKGRQRSTPVWVMRYRLPSGKDSKQTLGRAWSRRGRPPHGFLSEGDALQEARAFAAEHSADGPDDRRRYRAALEAFLARSSNERGLRGSTLANYRILGEGMGRRPWRADLTWADRPLDTFSAADLLAFRQGLLDAKRGASTLNHYRRVVRGIFGTAPSSPALAWPWMTAKVESDGKLHFYTPAQVRRLIANAHTTMDAAIYTLATEAGPRLSEIRALKVEDVDFLVELLRFEDGYTSTGGFAGNKGRRTHSVPMSANVARVLDPLCTGKAADALVFQHDTNFGEPICGVSLYRRFVSAAKRAGLPRITLHELRHTFGTQAIRRFKIHEVQYMMGHRSITTTERYLHYAPDPQGAAKLTELWGDRGRRQGRPGAGETSVVVPLRAAA